MTKKFNTFYLLNSLQIYQNMMLLFAGSVTVKETEAAGQFQPSKDAIRKESKESTTEEHKVAFSLASDTDSLESLEMQSKAEHDTEVHANEESDKPVDATDVGIFSQRLNRLSSSDSYLSSQDNVKSMAWYGSSLDFDSTCTKYAGSESPKLLDKINESSLESKLEDLHLGQVSHRSMNRTSTPSHEVRLVQGEEGNMEPSSPVKEEFNHDTGSRSSPESSGGGLYIYGICLLFFICRKKLTWHPGSIIIFDNTKVGAYQRQDAYFIFSP